MDERPTLSIVVPVYNEEENVRLLFEKIQAVCETMRETYEVLFVDDGSRDKTFSVLSELSRDAPQVGVIKFRENAGQTAAMAAGFASAQGERIVSMDGDLQNDPADIPKVLEKLDEGYDLVCGWRKERQDKFLTRRLPSIVANWIIGKVTGVPIHDNGCSLKAYRASVIKQVPLYGEMHRFIPAMSTVAAARIAEIVVTHHPRRFGESKYGLGRVWRVILDIVAFKLIISVFAPLSETEKPKGVWRRLSNLRGAKQELSELGGLARLFIFRYKRRPLRFFGPIGSLLFLLGVPFLIPPLHSFFLKTLNVTEIPSLGPVFMTVGILVFCFGLLGELIAFANAKWVKDYEVETFLGICERGEIR